MKGHRLPCRAAAATLAALGNLVILCPLGLASNGLSGDIPPRLDQLPDLAEVTLRGNDPSGRIPPALRRIPENDLPSLGLPDCGPA